MGALTADEAGRSTLEAAGFGAVVVVEVVVAVMQECRSGGERLRERGDDPVPQHGERLAVTGAGGGRSHLGVVGDLSVGIAGVDVGAA